MQTIPLAAAKADLSRLVDLAEHGETIVITRRGKAVARLVADHPAATAADVFSALWAAGGLDIATPDDLPAGTDDLSSFDS